LAQKNESIGAKSICAESIGANTWKHWRKKHWRKYLKALAQKSLAQILEFWLKKKTLAVLEFEKALAQILKRLFSPTNSQWKQFRSCFVVYFCWAKLNQRMNSSIPLPFGNKCKIL
jgi:hypothetical protein